MHTMMSFSGKGTKTALVCALTALALTPLRVSGAADTELPVTVVDPSEVSDADHPSSTQATTPSPTSGSIDRPLFKPTAPASESGSATPAGAAKKPGIFKTALSPVMTAADAISKTSVLVAQRMREEVLRMHDFFDVTLPGIAARHHLILDFEPKVGDLIRREYVRFPLEARYGISSRWETYGGVTPVAPNPIDGGFDHRWGMGMAELGLRYDLPPDTWFFKRISLGFEARQPLGNPPVDLIDGYMHLRPYITTSRPMPGLKDTTLFNNIVYDHSVQAPGHDDVPAEVIKRHMLEVAPGLLYKPGQFGYFGQYAIRYWDEPDGYRLEHLLKGGVIWDMPLARSAKMHLPGKWQIELGYKLSHLDGEKVAHGVHARVKVRTDFFKRKKNP